MIKRLLELFKRTGVRYFLITKAGEVPDDILQLLVDTAANSDVIVSHGMPSLELEQRIEFRAPPSAQRMAFAKKLKDAGVHVSGICAPLQGCEFSLRICSTRSG